jgi:hypothetical protein
MTKDDILLISQVREYARSSIMPVTRDLAKEAVARLVGRRPTIWALSDIDTDRTLPRTPEPTSTVGFAQRYYPSVSDDASGNQYGIGNVKTPQIHDPLAEALRAWAHLCSMISSNFDPPTTRDAFYCAFYWEAVDQLVNYIGGSHINATSLRYLLFAIVQTVPERKICFNVCCILRYKMNQNIQDHVGPDRWLVKGQALFDDSLQEQCQGLVRS